MNKFVALMRRYTFDYTNRQDFTACDTIMVPGYTLHMGTYDLAGRDEHYKPATAKQFAQFPGLCLTINEIVTNGDRLCLRFSEHGASVRHHRARAAWSGIGLYKWDGERLTENFVEQDYYSRREQLASGVPKAVEMPALAPWDTQPEPTNAAAEAVVRLALQNGTWLDHQRVIFDDAWNGGVPQRVVDPTTVRIDDLFSAGDRVAFRITQSGRLREDFRTEGINAPVGSDIVLHMAGLVTVADGGIVSGNVVRDRLGLYRRLQSTSSLL